MYYCQDTKEIANSYEEYLKTNHWKSIKNRLFYGNKLICSHCKTRYGISIHHITYDNIGNESDNDIVPLCFNCHNRFHNNFIPIAIPKKKYKMIFGKTPIKTKDKMIYKWCDPKSSAKNIKASFSKDYNDLFK